MFESRGMDVLDGMAFGIESLFALFQKWICKSEQVQGLKKAFFI